MKYYKICDKIDGNVKTLFHGVNGTRNLPKGQWVTADKKMVSDGSGKRKYLSGFHVLPTIEDCKQYLKRFKHTANKVFIECEVGGDMWPKEHSTSPVLLVDKIKFLGEVTI
jgi:hypothetical protein